VVAVRPTVLGELAKHLGRVVDGEADTKISGVASLLQAGPEDLAFVRSATLAGQLAHSRAGALIAPDGVDTGALPAIRSPNPELDFARALAWLLRDRRPPPGIDPSAAVARSAVIDPSAFVGPGVVVGERVRIGARCALHAGAVVAADTHLGEECLVHSGAVIREQSEIRDRVWVHSGAVIGNEGYGYTLDESGRPLKIPQVGYVVLEDDVEIGAGTIVQRGSLDATRVRRNAKLGDLCVIGHNSDIGEDVLMIGHTAIAGSVRIGRGVVIMGQVAISGHLTIGEGALIGARSGIHKDVRAGARVYGTPGMEERAWHRSTAAFARLPQLLRRVRLLEQRSGVVPAPDDGDPEA